MKQELKTWHFGIENDKLVELVLQGKKTATSSIYDGEVDEEKEESILVYSNGNKACKIRTIQNIICKFKDVTWDIAKLEGENNSLKEWKQSHENFFKSIDKDFNENTKILIEIFTRVD